jgi:molybdate transport system ATP-binding protein
MTFTAKNLRLTQGEFQLEIDLEVTGQVIGIFGPSGAGKTTLLEIVAGLRRPTSGRMALDDLVLMDTANGLFLPPEKRGMGYVPQDLALFPHLSVRQNLAYGHKRASAVAAVQDHRSAEPSIGIAWAHVTDVLAMGDLLDRSVAELSGGQKQRVAFARALLASPRLLLMDEPLANLDQDLKLTILPYLQRLRDEFDIPMLYVSHSPDEVAALCDQVVLLREGKCLPARPPGELFEPTTLMALKPGIFPR